MNKHLVYFNSHMKLANTLRITTIKRRYNYQYAKNICDHLLQIEQTYLETTNPCKEQGLACNPEYIKR